MELMKDVCDNIYVYGSTGIGKSRYMKLHMEKLGFSLYIKEINKWWCNYVNQDAVLLDDLDPDNMKRVTDVKTWLDHYKFNADIKGSMVCIRTQKVIVTSNYLPHELGMRDDGITLPKFMRMFKNAVWTVRIKGESMGCSAQELAPDNSDDVFYKHRELCEIEYNFNGK